MLKKNELANSCVVRNSYIAIYYHILYGGKTNF